MSKTSQDSNEISRKRHESLFMCFSAAAYLLLHEPWLSQRARTSSRLLLRSHVTNVMWRTSWSRERGGDQKGEIKGPGTWKRSEKRRKKTNEGTKITEKRWFEKKKMIPPFRWGAGLTLRIDGRLWFDLWWLHPRRDAAGNFQRSLQLCFSFSDSLDVLWGTCRWTHLSTAMASSALVDT